MYKVLICDDEAIIREGMQFIIDWKALGLEIIGLAANGDQAFSMIMSESPDIVLMDIRMPGMSGLDVISQTKNRGFQGHFIILSGFSDFRYAQQAIHLGVDQYLTKPVDEDALIDTLKKLVNEITSKRLASNIQDNYREKARDSIIRDLLSGEDYPSEDTLDELHLAFNRFQVVITEKYGKLDQEPFYSFEELIRIHETDSKLYDHVQFENHDVYLLKGDLILHKFRSFLQKYEEEAKPQDGSPLDSIFISYGREVTTLNGIFSSYEEAAQLISRRFFCDQGQHTLSYEELPSMANCKPVINNSLLEEYTQTLLRYIQAFNRNQVAETLHALQNILFNASDSSHEIKLFLSDLFLQIKNAISHKYAESSLSFPTNADIIKNIESSFYLYEIFLFFTEQFEQIMGGIGNSSRDSVLNDVIHYIDHNYASNITLENIAPLFGYNSSYLGKIFSKKMNENFNSYVDHVRIEHSKELLLNQDMKVYAIAEQVGYRNVDYFHIKFKKYVGLSPAEFRKKNRPQI